MTKTPNQDDTDVSTLQEEGGLKCPSCGALVQTKSAWPIDATCGQCGHNWDPFRKMLREHRSMQMCPTCNGAGKHVSSCCGSMERCDTCNGTGKLG